jgi:nicotinamide phosphoribosyltransferase
MNVKLVFDDDELTCFGPSIVNPILSTDHYKFIHKGLFPRGMDWLMATWTPRLSRIDGVNHVVNFGLQGVLAQLTQDFQTGFFDRDIDVVISEIRSEIEATYAKTNPRLAREFDYQPFRQLYELGYLPIVVNALPEGSFVPIRVPMFTVANTADNFGWLVGYIEVILSNRLWQGMTDATIANIYRRIFDRYADETSDTPEFAFLQGGDFSMRGLTDDQAAKRVGAAHLTSFGVTSTVSARPYVRQYYAASSDVNCYAPSVEHAVMCAYGKDEKQAFLALIDPVDGRLPDGNVTIVSDTYDFWRAVDQLLPEIREVILARNGKVSIRPDSGDPVKILCGDGDSDDPTIRKGLVERLFEIFGGATNSKGYKVLDPHIGAVYGDSITPARAEAICSQLRAKGFASTNVVFGIGSYTYQYNTRDTFGFGYKATAAVIDGEFVKIFEDPATDRDKPNAFKKSQKGLVAVVRDEADEFQLIDDLTPDEVELYDNELRPVYYDGQFVKANLVNFETVRRQVAAESARVYGR